MPTGSESLPKGIVRRTSDLEMQPLYGPPEGKVCICIYFYG